MAILNTDKNILKEGYLFKQSRHVWKLWKARYFVLQNNGLIYFKKKSDICTGRPLGGLTFRDISMHIDEVGDKKRKYCLKIQAEGKNYCLFCFSEEERNSWMTAILTAVASYMMAVRDGATDEELLGLAAVPMPRSVSCEALTSKSIKTAPHLRSRAAFGSSGDLDRIVPLRLANNNVTNKNSQGLPAMSKRKLKAFSMWENAKWRDSYINFSEI
ncbi:arf-GAP with coiled-coil, ANK repeat and PH domain-containing protein 2-like [Actinia tenebrosa]|uniref:Arf-GAP with coiled-coil, ANK repeat and PH domain-containing protein 2-like n=1 Tax=Actinia tenebrosa TaxID=6105 RepID=A0A6P8IJL8_ACTTE|nr:arf-GAP with coiled-coil, ANK repeat and PH domain-containing protein 2-like [Actinia tenebrosa]